MVRQEGSQSPIGDIPHGDSLTDEEIYDAINRRIKKETGLQLITLSQNRGVYEERDEQFEYYSGIVQEKYNVTIDDIVNKYNSRAHKRRKRSLAARTQDSGSQNQSDQPNRPTKRARKTDKDVTHTPITESLTAAGEAFHAQETPADASSQRSDNAPLGPDTSAPSPEHAHPRVRTVEELMRRYQEEMKTHPKTKPPLPDPFRPGRNPNDF